MNRPSILHRIITPIVFPFVLIIPFLALTPVAAAAYHITKARKNAHRFGKLWANILLTTCGIKVDVMGLENIPMNEPVIFACNHASQIDIPVLYKVLPVTFRFLVKKELFKIPVLGTAMRSAGYIPIDRSGGKAAVRSLQAAAQELKKGASIVIFPEGTRSLDGSLGPFKAGAFALAIRSKHPVIPVAIHGTYEILPKGGFTARPGSVRVNIGPPIRMDAERSLSRDEIASMTRETIAGLLKEKV